MNKIYILRNNDDLLYLEEVYYNSYNERYEKTIGVDPFKIFEPSELDRAMEIVYQWNK